MFIILGLGFGLPLIIGLPETVLTCGRQDFEDLIEDYGLERGLQPLLNEGYTKKVVSKELNHLVAILHVWILWSKKKNLLLFFKKKMEPL